MAAVLACGAGAALSHVSAAAHWGLLPPAQGPIDVSVPSQAGRRKRAGIRLHRRRGLRADEVVCRNDIPVTTPPRTIADLKGSVPEWKWRKAVRQAEFKKLPLGPGFETDRTRSDLERDFLRLCRRHGFPVPEVNVRVKGWTVDFLWREQRVAVETDFYDYHRGRIAFQDDHARDLALRQHGLDVRRYSEEQLNERPHEVVADLRDAFDGLHPETSRTLSR
jgi:very-short-patch-repair endonuclease